MKVMKILVLCLCAAPSCGGSTEDEAGAAGSAGSGASAAGGTAGATGGSGGTGAFGGGGSGGTGGGPAGSSGAGGGSGGTAAAGGMAAAGGTAGAGAVAGAGGAAGAAGSGAGAGVACGAATCASGEVCLVCDPTGAQSPKTCAQPFQDDCATFPNLQMFCDGHEDCAASERCMVVEGSVGTYLQCIEPNPCMDTCSCGAGAFAWGCRTLADCPPCATSCEPYKQWEQGAAYPVNVCRW